VISLQQQTPDNDSCHFSISNVRFAFWAFFSKTGKTRVSHRVKMMTRWPGREKWPKWPVDPMTQFHVCCRGKSPRLPSQPLALLVGPRDDNGSHFLTCDPRPATHDYSRVMTPDYRSFQSGPLSGSALKIKHHHCHKILRRINWIKLTLWLKLCRKSTISGKKRNLKRLRWVLSTVLNVLSRSAIICCANARNASLFLESC